MQKGKPPEKFYEDIEILDFILFMNNCISITAFKCRILKSEWLGLYTKQGQVSGGVTG